MYCVFLWMDFAQLSLGGFFWIYFQTAFPLQGLEGQVFDDPPQLEAGTVCSSPHQAGSAGLEAPPRERGLSALYLASSWLLRCVVRCQFCEVASLTIAEREPNLLLGPHPHCVP